jgi:MYXO-CTERM domain-containing protein
MKPFRLALSCVAALSLTAVPAAADIFQPNGTPIPAGMYCDGGKPGGLAAVFACQCLEANTCNIGASCPGGSTSCDEGKNGTCEERIWHNINDNACIPTNLDPNGLDPVKKAMIDPPTFQPTCPLAFKMVTRGNAMFKNIFGWYNVTGTKPDTADLHVMLDCNAPAGAEVTLDIQNKPEYLGGQIGFFIATPESSATPKTCANGDCCATVDRVAKAEGFVYYSQRDFNPDFAGAQSYIHLLIYDSIVWPHKYYFAWEDLFQGGNDNNFSDFVTAVVGVECQGGGLDCEVPGQTGRCKKGVTQCVDGKVECKQVLQSEAEACDGVDNDCNDLIDDNAICPEEMKCHNGRCVGDCTMGEFPCKEAYTKCDTAQGLCVPFECVGKTCDGGKVCRGGQCVSPCDGVVCPYGQMCWFDVCIDLCEGVKCDAPKTCRSGVCFEGCGQCNGAACGANLKCDTTSGQCADPSCVGGCTGATHCVNGTCVPNCDGAACPGGVLCVDGKCVPNESPQDAGVDGPVLSDSGNAGSGGGLFPDAAGNPDGHASEAGPILPVKELDSGCGCRAAPAAGSAWWLVTAAALAALLRRR